MPALGLMALIYLLSAQPDLGTGLGAWDLVLRKLAHAAEYALLFLLWVFALRGAPYRRRLAAAIAVLYAVSDELHQTTVDGRVGSPVDVLIDATGVALAALALRLRDRSPRAGVLGWARWSRTIPGADRVTTRAPSAPSSSLSGRPPRPAPRSGPPGHPS